MNILKKIVQRLRGRKKFYYLHITYKAKFGDLEWIESDRFFRINDHTIKELRHELKHYPRPWFHAKPKLPKGTRLKVKEQWANFYGAYFRCEHENGEYGIPEGKALIINS